MIASNIFRAIGDFFTNVLLSPFQSITEMDNWWVQNSVNWLFFILTVVFFLYWMGEMRKYKKAEEE